MELKLTGIRKHFGEKEVLRGCGFTFQQGKIYGLLGRNGAGKTTLFNCLTDEVPPDGGTAELVLNDGTRRALAPDDVGYVFATPILPDFLTGYEFVRFYMDVNAARIRDGRSADDYFDMVQIAPEDRHRLIKGYSHGMKNKMQMLVNMIVCPPVLLLDEPLTALDVVVAEEMKQLLRTLKQHSIIILSTHIMDLALNLCDEIVLLNHGLLEHLEFSDLNGEAFKERIISALREGTE